jgi:hypothetical protein
VSDQVPERGTEQYRWWHAGASAEARAIREGMQQGKAVEVYEFVLTMAQSGYGPETMTDMVATVYTCERPLRRRLSLAWEIIWGPYETRIDQARRRRKSRAR